MFKHVITKTMFIICSTPTNPNCIVSVKVAIQVLALRDFVVCVSQSCSLYSLYRRCTLKVTAWSYCVEVEIMNE